ncbi:MAG: hypothetical protein WC422_00530 [Candidatus Paceibacterota bacterium]|jgi:hypothetical protein
MVYLYLNRDPERDANIVCFTGKIHESDKERKQHIFSQILSELNRAWREMIERRDIVLLHDLSKLSDGDIVFLTHEADAKIINSLGKNIIIAHLRIPYESKELVREDNYTQTAYQFKKCPDYLVPRQYLSPYRENGKKSNTFLVFFHNFVRSQARKAITLLLLRRVVLKEKREKEP